MRNTSTRYSDTELINLLIEHTLEETVSLSNRDIINADNMPTHHTYINRFGSVATAKAEAGIAFAYTEYDYPNAIKLVADVLKGRGIETTINGKYVMSDGKVISTPLAIKLRNSTEFVTIDILPESPEFAIKKVAVKRANLLKQAGIEHNIVNIRSLMELMASLITKDHAEQVIENEEETEC